MPTTSPAADKPVPPELQPKRGPGRPPGSTNKAKTAAPPADLSPRALAAAYQGLWLVLRFCTWIVAGRKGSPVAQATGIPWTLDDLEADEALEDAKALMPFVESIGPLVRVLSWVGGPVILAKRISAKLRRNPPKPVAVPAPAAEA